MQQHRKEYSTSRMAKILEVSLSGYYDWLKRDISPREQHKNRCELLVKSAHLDTKESYGHERLQHHITNQGHTTWHYPYYNGQ